MIKEADYELVVAKRKDHSEKKKKKRGCGGELGNKSSLIWLTNENWGSQ